MEVSNRKFHFIAIGGVGMSGLAKYLLQQGHDVSGSDMNDSKYITQLRELGATVFIGHSSENVPIDATVIVSSAIRETNPELKFAKENGLTVLHRSDLLAEIANNTNKSFIGFAGTHGKTTTSGMSSYVLSKAGLEPSFVVGGIIPEYSTNAKFSPILLILCESSEITTGIWCFFISSNIQQQGNASPNFNIPLVFISTGVLVTDNVSISFILSV